VPRSNLPAVEVATEDVPVGTPILAIGYPASTGKAADPTLEPSSKNGQVSSHRSQDGHPFLEISAAVTHGDERRAGGRHAGPVRRRDQPAVTW
jgi:serine protease Do